jgi:hypothetical protein
VFGFFFYVRTSDRTDNERRSCTNNQKFTIYNTRKIAETLNMDLLEVVMRVYYSIICEYQLNVTAEF